jgi:hypothetical protein
MQGRTGSAGASGFPHEYHRRVRTTRIVLTGLLMIVVGGALLLIWGAIFRDWSVPSAAIAGAVSLWFTAVASSGLQECGSPDGVRIVPYFESAVPGVDTFFRSGHALARNCTYLDRIARAAGFTPLSAYGFADDWRGRRIPWYDAVDGLRTIAELLERLSADSGLVPELESTVADLERLGSRLEEARRLRVRFCLHLRGDQAYTGMEFEQRRGKY